jgi:putative oxidoreductase
MRKNCITIINNYQKMKNALVLNIIIGLLIVMFLYASFSKYFDFTGFRVAMHNQPFPGWFAKILIWILPAVEILTATLLYFEKTVVTGLRFSILLMIIFTAYIALILLHVFPAIPCTCGGVIKLLTWKQHLIFNTFFLFISIYGYWLRAKSNLRT